MCPRIRVQTLNRERERERHRDGEREKDRGRERERERAKESRAGNAAPFLGQPKVQTLPAAERKRINIKGLILVYVVFLVIYDSG